MATPVGLDTSPNELHRILFDELLLPRLENDPTPMLSALAVLRQQEWPPLEIGRHDGALTALDDTHAAIGKNRGHGGHRRTQDHSVVLVEKNTETIRTPHA